MSEMRDFFMVLMQHQQQFAPAAQERFWQEMEMRRTEPYLALSKSKENRAQQQQM